MRTPLAVVVLAVTLCIPASRAGVDETRKQEFVQSSAGVYARIQSLRDLEKGMLAHARNPAREWIYEERRGQTRRRIEQQMDSAWPLAADGEQFDRMAQLALMTRRADARFDQVLRIQPR